MTGRRGGAAPLYRQVEAELRRRIERGEWLAGDRLPPEPVLAAELAVNRLTVRQAIGELARAGALYARQGVGTFVAARPTHVEVTIDPAQRDVRADMGAGAGAIPGSAAESVLGTTIADAAEPRRELGAHRGSLRRVDTRFAPDGEPWVVSTYWLVDARFPGLADALAVHGRPFDALRHGYGVALRYGWRSFAAGAASAGDAALLEVPTGAPLLVREGLNLDADGDPVVFVHRRCRSDRLRFVLRYGLEDGPHPPGVTG